MSTIETRSASPLSLARALAERYGSLPQVEAVALGGSHASGTAGPGSDIDLYVYSRAEVPVVDRARVAAGASRAELGNRFWEPGDEWIDAETGIHVDVTFRTIEWIEDQVDRVLHPGEKRLVEIALQQCEKMPERKGQQIDALLQAASRRGTEVVERAEALIEGLDALLETEGLHSAVAACSPETA